MKRSTKLWLFVVLVIGVPFAAFFIWESVEDRYTALPVYGPTATSENGEVQHHVTEEFVLINQDGRKTGTANAEDKIAIVNFFFTSCPTICPKMTRQLQRVQEMYLNDPDVVLMSITVDPKHDDPSRLKKYAGLYRANPGQWHFLTGEKKEIYRLARKSYFLVASEGSGGDEDFIHSENLILIDRQRRIRGYYDGTDPTAVDQLINDIAKLKSSRS